MTPTVFELDAEMRSVVRGQPIRLLREEQPHPEVECMGRLLPPPSGLDRHSEIIGAWTNDAFAPAVVVTGVCQGGGRLEEKDCWLTMGPSLETFCILELSRAIAEYYRCPLDIWIVDQEYVNTAVDQSRFTSSPELELRIGERVAAWCAARFPAATVRRTSDPAVRADLYGVAMDGRLAGLYPTGIAEPYANKGSVFWQEVQFLASAAVFMSSVSRGAQALAVADHEQLRVMAAARQLVGEQLAVVPVWPCPRLGWNAPARRSNESSARYAERLLSAVKRERRRMYRAPRIEEMLFVDMSAEQVRSRCATPDGGTAIAASTLRETLQFLGAEHLSIDETASADEHAAVLHAALERVRQPIAR